MFGSSILEVAIGVVFVYLFISLICSAVNEGIASLVNKRGNNLFDAVKNLLNDPKWTGMAQQLYSHGLVDGISEGASDPNKVNRKPSYMPANVFSLALLDILRSKGLAKSWGEMVIQRKKELDDAQTRLAANSSDKELSKAVADAQAALAGAEEGSNKALETATALASADEAAKVVKSPKDLANFSAASEKLRQALAKGRALAAEYPDPMGNIQRAVGQLPDGHTKESLLVLIDKTKLETPVGPNLINVAQAQAERLQQNIEQWFNDAMTRSGGWYKRWTQKVLLGIAIVIVLGANVDTLMLAKRFMRDNALRTSIVTAAEKSIQSGVNPTTDPKARDSFLDEANKLSLPLGWMADAADPYREDQIPQTTVGWLMKLLGLAISIFAISLGAPFWFDILSKVVNLRGAGTPPGETKKSAPQPAAPPATA
jgi:hypothetical protein